MDGLSFIVDSSPEFHVPPCHEYSSSSSTFSAGFDAAMPPSPAAAAEASNSRGADYFSTTDSTFSQQQQQQLFIYNNAMAAAGTTRTTTTPQVLSLHDSSSASCSTTAGSTEHHHQSVYHHHLLDFPAPADNINRRIHPSSSSKRSTPCSGSVDDAASSISKQLPYECRFCLMKFAKSQALGGHMNRHRQEREREQVMNARKLLLQQQQQDLSSSTSIMIPSTGGSGGHHHHHNHNQQQHNHDQQQLQRTSTASSSMNIIMEGTTEVISRGELEIMGASSYDMDYAGGGGLIPYKFNGGSSASYALPGAAVPFITEQEGGGVGSWNELVTCSSAVPVPTTFAMGGLDVLHNPNPNHNNIHHHQYYYLEQQQQTTSTTTTSTDRERSSFGTSPLVMPPPPSYLSNYSLPNNYSSPYMTMLMMMMPPPTSYSPRHDQLLPPPPPPTTTSQLAASLHPSSSMLDVRLLPHKRYMMLQKKMTALENAAENSTLHVVSPAANDQATSSDTGAAAAAALDLLVVPPSGLGLDPPHYSLLDDAAGTPHHPLYSNYLPPPTFEQQEEQDHIPGSPNILPCLPNPTTIDFNNHIINGMAPNSMDNGMLLLRNHHPKAAVHQPSMASVVLQTTAHNTTDYGCHDLGGATRPPSLTHLAGGEPDEQSRALRWEIGGDLPSPSSSSSSDK